MSETNIAKPFHLGQLNDNTDLSVVKGVAIGVTVLLVAFYASGVYLNMLQIKKLKGKI